MLLGGDEFGRTQQGNNNAYCQDNEISWVDWRDDGNGEALTRFVARIAELRRRFAVLRQSRFLTAQWNEELGVKDATWLNPVGEEMTPEGWQDPQARCIGLLLDGRAQTSGIRRRGSEATLLLIVNAHHDVVLFTLPEVTGGRDWLRLADTICRTRTRIRKKPSASNSATPTRSPADRYCCSCCGRRARIAPNAAAPGHIDARQAAAYVGRMAVRAIITAPDPRLKIKAKPVAKVDAVVRRLMDDMLETMYHAVGIGLAAPQVGAPLRVLVVDVARDGEDPQPMRIANPEILWRSDALTVANEGCLSLPEHYADVERPAQIRLRYLDHENEIREIEASGLLATCIQHEIDHLDGILFVDHISTLKRGMILRKLSKLKRSRAALAAQ
jgi:peptide deformylase